MVPSGWSFEALSHRLVRTGMLGGPGEVLMLASSAPGEGVSTLAAGLAHACATQLTRPVVLVGTGLHDGGANGGGAEVRRLGYQLPLDPAGWGDALAQLRTSHAAVIIDAGSLETEGPAAWRPLVDRALLVIDMARARREALRRLGEELNRSPVRFDGFVANRKRFFIPDTVFRFLERQGAPRP